LLKLHVLASDALVDVSKMSKDYSAVSISDDTQALTSPR